MNRLKQFLSPFRRLQWKLTLSYTLVSTGALLVVELIFFAVILVFIGSDLVAEVMSRSIQTEIAPQVRPFLEQTPPDIDGLRQWSDSLVEQQTTLSPPQEPEQTRSLDLGAINLSDVNQQLLILSPDLTVLARASDNERPLDVPFDAASLGDAAEALTLARRGAAATRRQSDGAYVVAVPVTAGHGDVLGLIVLTFQFPLLSREIIIPFLQTIGVTLIPGTIATGLIGAVFGFLTARGLTRRIRTMAEAADAWSQGDFSPVARDDSGDELGQLSRRLNRMADQLQNLLEARQELAAVEERNRLARDLHDSVKQNVFATAMQLATARTLVDADPAAAKSHLAEAEQLTKQSQQELTGLIQELRPAALADRGLGDALRQYAADWSRRAQIAAEVRVQGKRPLPLATEQTLFRVAQEALANVARHSRARRADVHLVFTETSVTLTIRDDGRGFDPENIGFGVGLDSMRERVIALGGAFEIDSEPGAGTRLTAVIGKR